MVRKAVMDDFPVILNIYATARAFMAKTGNPTQWADGHPSADLLRECILAQKLFVFTDPDDFSQIDKVVDMYDALGVDRLATWTYRGGYGTSVAAQDALELWDNIGKNYKRVLKK